MTKLTKYNSKRDFTKTPEPKGTIKKGSKKLKFCVQHHLASHDHYDFRLEFNGVLLSWAIPKGPSFNPKDKRLAVHVENHPLSYRLFEGTIPQGEYGGGTVMLWDEGTYEPINNFKGSYPKGNLKFILHGQRLKGAWSLVKFKDNNWLLIKEKDKYVSNIDLKKYSTSIKTNRTMQEITNNEKKTKLKTSKKDAIVCGIKITNPDKIIFKNPRVTKLDIALYYHKIAPKMLPLIENRLISTIREPDGFNTPKFFKKHFTSNPYLGKINIKKGPKTSDYYYIKDEQGLINEVQMNSFEFHIWGSKIDDLNHPDLMVFDFDPDENLSLKNVREGVKDLQKILKEFNLKSTLKTSGGKGYHVMVPIDTKMSWPKFSKIAQNIAELMEARYPDKYTTNIKKEARKGKIFIDYLRNKKSATFVAPYSLRLKAKPSISYPIPYTKLTKIKPSQITINDILKN